MGRKVDCEDRPAMRSAANGDRASHELAVAAGDRKAEVAAGMFPRNGCVSLLEWPEQLTDVSLRDVDPRLLDLDANPIGASRRDFPLRSQNDAASLREPGGVAEKIEKDLAQLDRVAVHLTQSFGDPEVQDVPVPLDPGSHGVNQTAQHWLDGKALQMQFGLAILSGGKVQAGVDQAEQMLCRRADLIERAGVHAAEIRSFLGEDLRVADDGVEGGTQIVIPVMRRAITWRIRASIRRSSSESSSTSRLRRRSRGATPPRTAGIAVFLPSAVQGELTEQLGPRSRDPHGHAA
jgi:hypothetical protein